MDPVVISGLIIAPVILATLFFYIFWKLCQHYCRNDSNQRSLGNNIYVPSPSPRRRGEAMGRGVESISRGYVEIPPPTFYSIRNEYLDESLFSSVPTGEIVPNSARIHQWQLPTRRVEPCVFTRVDAQMDSGVDPPRTRRVDRPPIRLQNEVNQRIAELQSRFRDSDANQQAEMITEVQQLLLKIPDTSMSSQGCRLVIGVDATPAAQAGYCVNLKDKTLSYYVIHKDQLPWQLHDSEDPSEFEMKNLMFALTLWENEIVKGERVRIYTDNFAITKQRKFDKNQYGERAYNVLQHFEKCKNVTVLNSRNMAVNKNTNLELFARYIQPADDLSRFHIDDAVQFLTELYGISKENVLGTHCKDTRRPQTQDGRPWYRPNERYREILRCAQTSINRSICDKCSRADLLQSSLRIGN